MANDAVIVARTLHATAIVEFSPCLSYRSVTSRSSRGCSWVFTAGHKARAELFVDEHHLHAANSSLSGELDGRQGPSQMFVAEI